MTKLIARGRCAAVPARRLARWPARWLAALSLGVLAGAAAAEPGDVERGRELAETLCARCHAVGRTGESPHAEAPALRTISERYPVFYLEEALAEGIVVGHDAMPEIALPVEDVASLVDYLETIQTAADGPE